MMDDDGIAEMPESEADDQDTREREEQIRDALRDAGLSDAEIRSLSSRITYAAKYGGATAEFGVPLVLILIGVFGVATSLLVASTGLSVLAAVPAGLTVIFIVVFLMQWRKIGRAQRIQNLLATEPKRFANAEHSERNEMIANATTNANRVTYDWETVDEPNGTSGIDSRALKWGGVVLFGVVAIGLALAI